MSNLLINERPLQVLPSLAEAIGLQEAVVLQQVHYWIQSNKESKPKETHFHEGRWWTYNSAKEWQENFSWWSESTVRKYLARLREKGLLLTGHHSKDKRDRTLWYTIDYDALNTLIEPHNSGANASATDSADGPDRGQADEGATGSADVYKEHREQHREQQRESAPAHEDWDFSFLSRRDRTEHLSDILDTRDLVLKKSAGKPPLPEHLVATTQGGLNTNPTLLRSAKRHIDSAGWPRTVAAHTIASKKSGLSPENLLDQWANPRKKRPSNVHNMADRARKVREELGLAS